MDDGIRQHNSVIIEDGRDGALAGIHDGCPERLGQKARVPLGNAIQTDGSPGGVSQVREVTGALVRGESLSSAAGEAAAFVRACAERTAAEDLPMREGVDFEPLLGLLIPGKETV